MHGDYVPDTPKASTRSDSDAMPLHFPTDRSLISVTGDDAEHFLQNLLTCDVEKLPEGVARACALLTPQGKIMWDFLILRDDTGGYLIDIDTAYAADFVRRLTMYKLRSAVTIDEIMSANTGARPASGGREPSGRRTARSACAHSTRYFPSQTE